MKILIVAATWDEIKPLEKYLQQQDELKTFRDHAIELCVTGIGSTFTAFHLGKILPQVNWDCAINLGICGAFNKEIEIGTTVNVVADSFADLGAEDGKNFLDAFELGLVEKNSFPFSNGILKNLSFEKDADEFGLIAASKKIIQVKAITVNTVHGKKKSIEKILSKHNAQIESMEGAAFIYCCMKESIPFLQIRTVSNFIERRDQSKWNIPLAIKNLNETAIEILESLLLKK